MGFKKTLPTFYPFKSTPISSTTLYVSPSTFVGNLDNIGCMVGYTGTPTGTLTVNVSNDNVLYTAITFNPAIAQPRGTPLTFGIDLNQVPWPYLQFDYTHTSGTGTLTISIYAKDLN
jgi:hypothetical protein